MKKSFLTYLQKMYLYASVCDKSAVYEQMKKDLLFCQVEIEQTESNELEDTIHFIFGEYENIKSINITYALKWEKSSYITTMGKEMTKYRLVKIE